MSSAVGLGAAMRGELRGTIGNSQPLRRDDGALDQADLANKDAIQFGGDGEV